MMLIGIHGKSHSGKTSLSRWLGSSQGFKERSFSNPIRQLCQMHFDGEGRGRSRIERFLERPQFFARPTREWERNVLRIIGSAYRAVDEDYWLRQCHEPSGNTVYDDVRYPNEARWVRDRGGILIRLTEIPIGYTWDEHESETALDEWTDWDAVYERIPDSTVEDMYAWAEKQLQGVAISAGVHDSQTPTG